MKTYQLIRRALHIKRTLGIRRAASYLRNRDTSLEAALAVLIGHHHRSQ